MVLLIALAMILILAILTAGLFGFARYELHRSKKQLEQDRGVAGMETAVIALRGQIRNQFWSNSSLIVSSLNFDQASSSPPNEQTGYFSQSLSVQLGDGSGGDKLIATQSRPSLLALQDPEDPFRGSLAVVDLLHVSSHASRLGQGPVKAFDPLPLQAQPVLAVRQIPLSQFSLYSSGDLPLDAALTPTVGRTYAVGNVTIENGVVETDFPLAAGANIDLAGGGALQARSDPDSAAVSMQLTSTTDPNWPALSKSVDRSTILSGRDLPMGTMSAATISQLTTSIQAPSQDQDDQRLSRQCSRTIYEGRRRLYVYRSDGTPVPFERTMFGIYRTKKYVDGPVIVFDYKKVAPVDGRNSFYIVSTNPYAIILIRNAATLTSDLSIVTPHPIAVAGELNTTAAHSASLVATGGVFNVPEGW
jgi:hypothetical protein